MLGKDPGMDASPGTGQPATCRPDASGHGKIEGKKGQEEIQNENRKLIKMKIGRGKI